MSSALPSQLLQRDPDETADIERLIAEVVPDAEAWKQTPNAVLGGKRPIDLLHTPEEPVLRDLLRAAKHGIMS
ncbi:MAG TPA: antitoxin Xre/MbcA/ParS toxin-binding domain-containing protein [Gemmataceae bacterium]|nr:antitoxin Xre/MbcA/ParS toxin-binding domain-containing protein [Gemmataceae bacterium]